MPVGNGGRPHPADVHVGSRVRLKRTDLGMTQEGLAEAIGLTFQQVQKYERGENRIGASRLFDISRALFVPIEFFFKKMPAGVGRRRTRRVREIFGSASGEVAAARIKEAQTLVEKFERMPRARQTEFLIEFDRLLASANLQ